MPRVLYYLQHLLGIGHVRRSALIVEGLSRKGFEVHLVFGGVPVSQINFDPAIIHQLTSVRCADGSFAGLVTEEGEALSEESKQARCAELLSVADTIDPEIIVTETYPFGRRMMSFELNPLLHWAQEKTPRPMLVSSIRDILQRRRPERERESLEMVDRFYDHVWIHGDPDFLPLERSFPPAAAIIAKRGYTGYVCPKPLLPGGKRQGIVLSIGGGAVGFNILETAVEVFRSGFLNDRQWTILAGLNLPDHQFRKLKSLETANLNILRNATDFLQRLANAELSVSMAGYNTVMDILQSAVPAVVVPFEGAAETEQLMRARRLSEIGRLEVVQESELTPENLKRSMARALGKQTVMPLIKTNGADRAAELLTCWWKKRG
jgi:predicted glycosyltransferase